MFDFDPERERARQAYLAELEQWTAARLGDHADGEAPDAAQASDEQPGARLEYE